MTKEQKFSDALAVQVERRIFLVRGQKVMLDTDLAELYRVPTKSLNLAVKRNADRFPEDFTFQLTDDEAAGLRFHFETSKRGRGGRRYLPYAFTEQGVAMLSSVLRSPRAVQVNIAIMRTFVRLREMLLSNAELARKLAEFGDESDTAQGITPTHHQFATSTARAATAQNWFSPALNHAEASAKAAAFYLSAIRIPHSAFRNPQFPSVLPSSFLIFFPLLIGNSFS